MNARPANCNGKHIEAVETSTCPPHLNPTPSGHESSGRISRLPPGERKFEKDITPSEGRGILNPRHWLNEINPYLPVSFANPDEETYINSLRETFELNYVNEKYEFAHFAFHLLYMSFAAFNVWIIFKTREMESCI